MFRQATERGVLGGFEKAAASKAVLRSLILECPFLSPQSASLQMPDFGLSKAKSDGRVYDEQNEVSQKSTVSPMVSILPHLLTSFYGLLKLENDAQGSSGTQHHLRGSREAGWHFWLKWWLSNDKVLMSPFRVYREYAKESQTERQPSNSTNLRQLTTSLHKLSLDVEESPTASSPASSAGWAKREEVASMHNEMIRAQHLKHCLILTAGVWRRLLDSTVTHTTNSSRPILGEYVGECHVTLDEVFHIDKIQEEVFYAAEAIIQSTVASLLTQDEINAPALLILLPQLQSISSAKESMLLLEGHQLQKFLTSTAGAMRCELMLLSQFLRRADSGDNVQLELSAPGKRQQLARAFGDRIRSLVTLIAAAAVGFLASSKAIASHQFRKSRLAEEINFFLGVKERTTSFREQHSAKCPRPLDPDSNYSNIDAWLCFLSIALTTLRDSLIQIFLMEDLPVDLLSLPMLENSATKYSANTLRHMNRCSGAIHPILSSQTFVKTLRLVGSLVYHHQENDLDAAPRLGNMSYRANIAEIVREELTVFLVFFDGLDGNGANRRRYLKDESV